MLWFCGQSYLTDTTLSTPPIIYPIWLLEKRTFGDPNEGDIVIIPLPACLIIGRPLPVCLTIAKPLPICLKLPPRYTLILILTYDDYV